MGRTEAFGTPVIKAAGGLLWRSYGGSWQIAVIHRHRYDDWSLPKGKLKPGETWKEAALREILEETGFLAQIVGFAGAVSYTTVQGSKVVRFWHMLAGSKVSDPDRNEISELAWLTREEAKEKLQYPLDLALLNAWVGPGQADEEEK